MSPRATSLLLGCHLVLLGAAFVLGRGLDGRAGEATGAPGLPEFAAQIEEGDAEVLLLGNSMLHYGVHEELLDALLVSALGDDAPRVTSAFLYGTYTVPWFLILKNYVAGRIQPRMVVFVFRDPVLTMPGFRATGPYAETLVTLRGPDEPEVDAVLGIGQAWGDRGLAWLRRRWPQYDRRGVLQEGVFDRVKGWPASLDADLPDYDDAVAGVLPTRAEGTDPAVDIGREGETTAAPSMAVDVMLEEARSHGAERPFAEAWPESILPDLLELCERLGVLPVFVRMADGLPGWEAALDQPALEVYRADVDGWLRARGSVVLDIRADSGLGAEVFQTTTHLDDRGREHFTAKLAHWLAWAEENALDAGSDEALRRESERRFGQLVSTPLDALVERRAEELSLQAGRIRRIRKHLYRVRLPPELSPEGDDVQDRLRSRWRLYEDDVELGPAHRRPVEIASVGAGLFGHQPEVLDFSSSDGTSARENGRRYVLRKDVMSLRPLDEAALPGIDEAAGGGR